MFSVTTHLQFHRYSKKNFLVLVAAGNDGRNSFSKTVGAPGTCKNCLVVGATQLSDSLFRGMKPLVDQGWHCQYSDPSGCCQNPNSCIQTTETVSPCCSFTAATKMSLACCPTQTSSINVRHPYNVAPFSSRGSSLDDGRIKPDLVAPGEDILSAHAPGVDKYGVLIPTSPGYCQVPNPFQARTAEQMEQRAASTLSGTSMSTPLAAGAVEKIRQYFIQGYYPLGTKGSAPIDPDESLLRAVILASAKPLSNGGVWNKLPWQSGFARFSPISTSNAPDIFGGFGMPILDNAVTMPSGTYKMFYASETFDSTSVASAFTVACSGQAQPVTLVLAWTDPPGSTSSKKQLVNDLDLIVLVPGASPGQLFGNMRQFADQSNNVERTICNCPSNGTITAIVVVGQSLKTINQKWYLVANGPITQALTKLSLVPKYLTGRISPPLTTATSCTSSVRSSHTLFFLPGKTWLGSSSDWGLQLKYHEFSTALSTFARVNFQAVTISMTGSPQDAATLSLGCSVIIKTVQTSPVLEYITAAALFYAIKVNCGVSNSICTTDPVLSVFNWTAFSGGSVPPPPPPPPPADVCNSFSNCADCTSASSCGWCTSLATCKTGSTESSADRVCAAPSTWDWMGASCSGPSPTPTPAPDPSPSPTPPSAPITSTFIFRLIGYSISSWTTADSAFFQKAIQSLLKDTTSIVRILGVRSGSVVLDTEVAVTDTSKLQKVNAVLTNAAVIEKVPEFGPFLSVVAMGGDSACKGYQSQETCTATSGCGWCLKVVSCMPGSQAGATVPPGSVSTCSGSDWIYGTSCASMYLVVSQFFVHLVPFIMLSAMEG
jgi:hypothetical protein